MISELLGIRYPILQGGMALVSEAELAAAVSDGGGAGIIGSCLQSGEWLRQEIRKARSLTDRPFGVNVMLMADNIGEIVSVIAEEKPAFATFGAGNPIPHFAPLQAAGVKCIPIVANVKQAQKVAAAGADAVVAEGMESGGHIGSLTTMALMSQVIPNVDIPVVIAGGIADGRGLAAALTMGAAGVQIGTAFLVAKECRIHENVKKRLVAATDSDTTVIGSTVKGEAMRGITCPASEAYLAAERSGASEEKLRAMAWGIDYAAAFARGDLEAGMILCGQSLRLLKEILPAEEIINNIMSEARYALNRGRDIKLFNENC